MSSTRAASKHVPRYHYALLLASTTTGMPADRPTLVQLFQQNLGDWFGAAGGVNSNEVEVVSILGSTTVDDAAASNDDRLVLLRSPRSITPQLLTALPLFNSSKCRIQVLNDSDDLSREEKGRVASSSSSSSDDDVSEEDQERQEARIAKKSLMGLFLLTIAIGGAQIVASVLSAWGSTYLFELGLTTQVTALIWLGGPLAQVVVQPIVAALSDDEAGRFRRRGWVIGSAIILATSIVYLVHATDFSTYLFRHKVQQETVTMIIAVVSVYVLNASLTGLQSGTKTLAIDVAPPSQQQRTSALGNRLSDVCSILAYGVGAYPLERLGILNWMGGGQFRKLAYLATGAMIVTMIVTCTTQHENPEMQEVDTKRIGLVGRVREMRRNVWQVPLSIRLVCYAQIFSWMALFPFLVYSTTYVANIALVSMKPTPSGDDSARLGSLALVFHQLVCLLTASTVPYLTLLSSNKRFARYLNGPSTPLRRSTARILLLLSARNFWSLGLLVHAVLMLCTFWVKTEWSAVAIVTAMGFPYAIALWAPYALLTEAYLEQKAKAKCPSCTVAQSTGKGGTASLDDYNAAMNSDSSVDFDRIPILRRLKRHLKPRPSFPDPSIPSPAFPSNHPPSSNDSLSATNYHHPSCTEHPNFDPFEIRRPFHKPHSLSSRLLDEAEFSDHESSLAGLSTTIVTLHNLSMLVPQIVIATAAAAAFKFVNARYDAAAFGGETKRDTDEIVWLFRATGVLALGGCVVTRFFGETRWEETVRNRLNVKRWI
ncbi:hypothetical protein JCM11491_000029 [Sporobolomyces phaffii]